MPIFEGYCGNSACSRHGRVVEFLVRRYTDPSKPCPECKTEVRRLVGKPNVVWAKPLSCYDGQAGKGHWVDGKNDDGSKYRTFIETRQQQLDHCRANGLYDPMEIDRHGGLSDSGKEEAGKEDLWSQVPANVANYAKDDNWI